MALRGFTEANGVKRIRETHPTHHDKTLPLGRPAAPHIYIWGGHAAFNICN